MSQEEASRSLEASRAAAALDEARRIGPGGTGPMLSSWVESTTDLLHALEELRLQVNRAMDRVQVGGGASNGHLIEAFCNVRTLDATCRDQRAQRDAQAP